MLCALLSPPAQLASISRMQTLRIIFNGLLPAQLLRSVGGRQTERSGDGQILNCQSMPLPPALLPSELDGFKNIDHGNFTPVLKS